MVVRIPSGNWEQFLFFRQSYYSLRELGIGLGSRDLTMVRSHVTWGSLREHPSVYFMFLRLNGSYMAKGRIATFHGFEKNAIEV